MNFFLSVTPSSEVNTVGFLLNSRRWLFVQTGSNKFVSLNIALVDPARASGRESRADDGGPVFWRITGSVGMIGAEELSL